MGDLIQFIFGLENPVGRNIVWVILTFFVFGVLNYLWHIVVRLPWEWWNLRQAKAYFQANPGVENLSDLLKDLRGAKVWSRSIISRRVTDYVRIKQSGGEIDNDALADILTGQESRKASFASHTLGILIILGLVGTLWGLITALIKVQPLLTGIQDFEQLPEISQTLRSTVSSMSTAFATTLTGLGTSLLLGILGWFFNRLQSTFLTRFETYVSTVLMPQFVQTTDTSIETAVQNLSKCTNMLEFATQENVRAMQQAIQQLTDTSWGGQLEQQYILANKFGVTAETLLESLTKIAEYQVLIKSTVASFETLIAESMSQTEKYQEGLRQDFEDSVSRLEADINVLKKGIEAYQNAQSRFIDDLSSTLRKQFQSITANQESMVNVLERLADEVQVRSVLAAQNQIFERMETQLGENQQGLIHAFRQLTDELQNRLHAAFETQNEVFRAIKTQLSENQQETVNVLTQLDNNTQTRFHAAFETQNEVFRAIETQLRENQQETVHVLTQLDNNTQTRFHAAFETQNEVFRAIETQLRENQQETVHVLTQLDNNTQTRFHSAFETQNEVFRAIETQLRENQQETVNVLERLADEVQVRSVLAAQNQIFERIETQLGENQQGLIHAFRQLTDELQNRFHAAFETQNEVFRAIETQLRENQQETVNVLTQLDKNSQTRFHSAFETQNEVFRAIETQLRENQQETVDALTQLTDELQIRSALEAQNQVFARMETQLRDGQQRTFDVLERLTDELQIRSALETQNQAFGRIESHLTRHSELMAEQKELMQTLIANLERPPRVPPIAERPTPGGDSGQQIPAQLLNQISLKFDLLNQKIDTLNTTARQPGIYRWFSEIRRWFGGSR